MKKQLFVRCLFIALFLAAALQRSAGQSEILFTGDKELPNSMITAIDQDALGNMWIGTEDGLCLYDGAKFKVYKQWAQERRKNWDNMVTALRCTRDGLLYVGFMNGLQCLDPQTDLFAEIVFKQSNGDTVDLFVQSIIERENRDILIGTLGRGVFLLKKGARVAVQEPFFNEMSIWFVNAMHEDHQNRLWIGAKREGILYIQNDGEKYRWSRVPNSSHLNIMSFCSDLQGNLYVGTTLGLYVCRIGKETTLTLIKGTEKYIVRSLYINKRNELFVGTDGDGVRVYSLSSGRIAEKNLRVASVDLKKLRVRSILEDHSGNLWFGIYQKGVLVKPAAHSRFGYIGHKSVGRDLIGETCVSAILKDGSGNLWVAADNDGLYCIDKLGRQIAHFSKEKGNNVPKSIICLFEDSRRQLWAGTEFEGLMRINKSSGQCNYVDSLRNISVLGIQEDHNRTLWVGTMGKGLYQLDLDGLIIFHAPMTDGKHYRPESNVLNNSWINGLVLTRDHKLLINTCDGLGCYNLDKKSFISTFGRNRILGTNIVNVSFEDAHHNIWVGTNLGLYCWNPSTREIVKYDVEQGLSCNTIHGICDDSQGNLWITTNYGISKFDIKKHTFVNYYANDGLQGNGFSLNAIYKDTKGIIYAGGVNGITYFDPDSIVKQTRSLKVRITDLYLHDQAVKVQTKSGGRYVMSRSEDGQTTYRLSAKDNSFCIEFATDQFGNAESINYLYSLNGHDWVALQRGVNKVYFSDMNAGSYTFRVKAQNYEEQSPVEEIKIIVRPFWYASKLAILLYALLILALAYYIDKQVRRRKMDEARQQEQERKEEINEAKMQFFINISHEIRTPMTLIVNPLRRLLSMDKDEDCKKLYRTISRNVDRILLLVNQMLDIRKIDKGLMKLKFQKTDVVCLVKQISDTFDERFAAKNIRFEFNTDVASLSVYIDPNYFDKVIANLLSNAVKYTPENGEIQVSVRSAELDSCYEIEVRDNGIGISDGQMDAVFERFYQVDNNLNEANVGTGVGLHLTRLLVEMHHGRIWAENNGEKAGVRFVVNMPSEEAFLQSGETIELKGTSPSVKDSVSLVGSELEEWVAKPKRRYRILIAEDDTEICNYLQEELGADFHVEVCGDGKAALEKMQKSIPDLVVSDILMPKMDGIALCKKIKQNIRLNHIPVILLTAKGCDEDKQEGLAIGADYYMTKPFNVQVLRSTILNMLYNREKLRNIYQGQQQQNSKMKKIEVKTPDDKLMERIMKSIDKNIANADFTVEMLAEDVGLSRVHLHRKMKDLTNQTTRDFIRNVRLGQAAKLLKTKGANITEVSNAVGFTSINHFSYAFKELYGVSPSEYWEKANDLQ